MNPTVSTQSTNNSKASVKGMLSSLEEVLNTYLVQKAPPLSKAVKDFFVQYGPWILLFFLVLGCIGFILLIPLLFAVSAVSSVIGVASQGAIFGIGGTFTLLIYLAIGIVQLVLEGLSIPGLLNKTKAGWNYLFYAQIIGAILAILNLSLVAVVISAIYFYVLFQIREYYTK